jgi:hypothetical protein
LGWLDKLIDMVEQQAAMKINGPGWMFVMSSTAESRISQLAIANQRYLSSTEVAAGLNVSSYRGIPMVTSSFLSARSYQMGTVTTATATTGGTLAAATYYYQIAPVIARQGEILPSVEVSQATTGSYLDRHPVVLHADRRTRAPSRTCTRCTGPPAPARKRSSATSTPRSGSLPTASPRSSRRAIVDDGAKLTPKNGSTVPASGPAAYVGTNASMKPQAAGSGEHLPGGPRQELRHPPVRAGAVAAGRLPDDVRPGPAAVRHRVGHALAVRAPKFLGRAARVTTTLSS